MTETSRNTLVGLFVIAALAALATLIVMFGSGPTWLTGARGYTLNIRFDTADGIREGNVVTIGGIVVGRVRRLDFVSGTDYSAGVNVLVAMDAAYGIPEGTRAVTTLPVLGQGRPPIDLVIENPSAPLLPPGATIPGKIRGGFDAIFPPTLITTLETTAFQIGTAAEALAPVLREVEQLVQARTPSAVDEPGGPAGNLASALTRLDTLLRDANEVFGDAALRDLFRESIENVHRITVDGKVVAANLQAASGEAQLLISQAGAAVARLDGTLVTTERNIETITRDVRGVLEKASTFMDSAVLVGQQMASGEGTVARLLTDGRLYEAMTLTFQRLALAVEDFSGLIAEWRKGKIRVGF